MKLLFHWFRLFAEDIADSIRDEIKRLQRRKQLHTGSASPSSAEARSASPIEMSGGSSPPHIGMMSLDSPVHSPSSDAVSLALPSGSTKDKDKPLFTMRQVSLEYHR